MTREEAKELLPIIQAYADGKTIEVYQKGFGEWRENAKPNFDGDPKNYRVKPEPKYRPFRTQEECWKEMHKHPDFGWLKSKKKDEILQIGRIYTIKSGDVMMTFSIDEGINKMMWDVLIVTSSPMARHSE